MLETEGSPSRRSSALRRPPCASLAALALTAAVVAHVFPSSSSSSSSGVTPRDSQPRSGARASKEDASCVDAFARSEVPYLRYPRQYVAYEVRGSPGGSADGGFAPPPVVDGKLDDLAWEEVGWSEDFRDISDLTGRLDPPRFRTRVKMRWDASWLYVAAEMQEREVWANQTAKNSVVFRDDDFEIFVDADGSTHAYKEFEVNALNTTWDLLLNAPYGRDGGYENSTRTFGAEGFSMTPPLRSSVFVAGGRVNDPSAGPASHWTVEVALPVDRLTLNTTADRPPAPGHFWRINFSRVEWRVVVSPDGASYWKVPDEPEDNWAWSPQGAVAMHLPERWGMLQFASGAVNATPVVRNRQWTVRAVAATVYYAQQAWFDGPGKGCYTEDVTQLTRVAPPGVLDGECVQDVSVTTFSRGGGKGGVDGCGFVAKITALDGKQAACVWSDRRIDVVEGAAAMEACWRPDERR